MEEIAEGVFVETTLDDDIQIIKLKSVARSSIDAWSKHITDLLLGWQAEKPYLMMYDFTDPKVSFTAYIRQKSSEMHALRPDVTGKIGVVMLRNTGNYLVMLFAQLRPRAARQIKIFFDRESAMAWLNDRTLP